MSYRLQKPALLLAALLQLLPVVRTICTHPAAASTFAFILRWGIGAGAVLGSVDAVSGATSVFTTPSTFSGTVGTPFSANVTVSIGGGNNATSSDYLLVSSGTTSSPLLYNGQTTTLTMPPGLTFTASWVNGATTIGGTITGTPTTAGSYPTSVTIVSPGNASLSQNITITITGTTTPTAPAITTPPAATNVVAGKTATFTVTASGTAPLGYFWLKNGAALANGGNVSGVNTSTLTLATVAAADAGSYSVLVSNSVGTVTSAAAALTVIVPPAVTTPPTAQTQSVGASAVFSVTASGSTPLSYRWLKNSVGVTNGTKFSGAVSNVLTIATLATNDAGNYSVVITNLAGSVTSSVAPLTVVSSPAIATPPANVTVVAGGNASFTVTATGSAPLAYQWLKNGAPLATGGNITGATTATLGISAVTSADAASYSVTVSNSLGTVTSASATLTVAIPPAIVTAPASATILAGSNVSFTVTASGTAPLAYQWLKNGATISGATSATLALTSVAITDAGNYSVTVTNAVGTATSAAATLTVLAPPVITLPPASTNVVQGNLASFKVTATGTAPLNFQWLKGGVPIAGATSNILTLAAVTTNDAANYYVVVTNIVGSTTSSSAALTVLVPPTIVTPPASATVVAGSNATFTVVATGSGSLTYQWLKNGGNISGATSATLTLTAVAIADAANYSVVVGNAAASITSSAATLTVLAPPVITLPPASTNVVQGNLASFKVTVTGTAPLNFQWLKDGAAISGATSNILMLAAVTTNDAGSYSVVVTNIVGSTTSSSAALTVLVPPAIDTAPVDVAVVVGNTAVFTVTATGTAPLTYQWLKNGATIAGATSATLTLANVSAANAGNYAVVVANAAGSVTSGSAVLTVQSPPSIVTQPANQFGALGTTVNLSVVANGTGPLGYQWFKAGAALADGGNISGSATGTLTITGLTTNEISSYYVVVSNAFGSVTSATANISVNVAPIIVTQPANQTVAVSNTVILTVATTGTGPMAYQWVKDGVKLINFGNYSGVKSASLKIANVATKHSGAYSVIVTNIYGRTTSAAATLTVLIPPSIAPAARIAGTANRSVKAGTNVTFSVTAKGSTPLSYRWFKNGYPLADGGNVAGATTNILKISALTPNDTAAYSVVVSNPVGAVTNGSINLTVFTPPVIVTQPASQPAVIGDPKSFTVAATGTDPLHYQWFKNTKLVAGATNFTLNLTVTKTNDGGAFFVIVTNFAGSVTSAVATLKVWLPPVFTLQATNRIGTNGASTAFSATVKGTAPFSYQWFKNGVPLQNVKNVTGAFSNVLNLSNLTTNDNGAYVLTVGNYAGSITSSVATLVVKRKKQINNDNVVVRNSASVQPNVVIVPPPAPVIASISRNVSGGITLNCSGSAGSNYIVEASSDLVNWTAISTNAAPAAGNWQVNDPGAAPTPARFYRLATP